MSKIASVVSKLKKMSSLRTAEDGEQYDPEPIDMDEVAAQCKQHGLNEGVELSFDDIVSGLKAAGSEPYVEIPDHVYEWLTDRQYDVVLDVLKDMDIDDDNPEYEEAKDRGLEAIADVSTLYLSNPPKLLIKDTEHGSIELSDLEGDDLDEQVQSFLATPVGAAAKPYFTDAEIRGFVGSINDSDEVYLGILCDNAIGDFTVNSDISGKPILVSHDSINGAGNYEDGKGEHTAAPLKGAKDLLDRMDYGPYSLGDVFSTNHWDWRLRKSR